MNGETAHLQPEDHVEDAVLLVQLPPELPPGPHEEEGVQQEVDGRGTEDADGGAVQFAADLTLQLRAPRAAAAAHHGHADGVAVLGAHGGHPDHQCCSSRTPCVTTVAHRHRSLAEAPGMSGQAEASMDGESACPEIRSICMGRTARRTGSQHCFRLFHGGNTCEWVGMEVCGRAATDCFEKRFYSKSGAAGDALHSSQRAASVQSPDVETQSLSGWQMLLVAEATRHGRSAREGGDAWVNGQQQRDSAALASLLPDHV